MLAVQEFCYSACIKDNKTYVSLFIVPKGDSLYVAKCSQKGSKEARKCRKGLVTPLLNLNVRLKTVIQVIWYHVE